MPRINRISVVIIGAAVLSNVNEKATQELQGVMITKSCDKSTF